MKWKQAVFLAVLIILLLTVYILNKNIETTSGDQIHLAIGDTNANDPNLKPLLGVISGPDQPEDSSAPTLTEQYHDIGVTSIRNNDYYDDRLDIEGIFNCGGKTYPSWAGCDPENDAYYNWEKSDAQFQSYINGDFEPFLRLGGEWENGNTNHDFKGPQNEEQEINWIRAAEKVVDRYYRWDGKQRFTYLDIWTEFPGSHFWDRSNKDFYHFWGDAYSVLHEEYPDLKIGGPGFNAGATLQVIEGEDGPAEEFMSYMYSQKIKPDWIGWHIFQNTPESWKEAAEAYQELIDGTGRYKHVAWAGTGFFNGVEQIVDAYGASDLELNENGEIEELSAKETVNIHNKQKGAAILTGAWIEMQYGPIERAYYYRGNDPNSAPNTKDLKNRGGPGLFYGDSTGTYKPTAYAFKLWSRIVNEYPTLLTVDLDKENPDLWVLAAKNDDEEKAILLANTGTTEKIINIGQWTKVLLYQIDDSNNGEIPITITGDVITIPAETVILLTLQ